MEKLTAIYWLKRDFRLSDNIALTAALAECEKVVPIFVLEPSFLSAPETSAFHVHAVTDALADLERQFQERGKHIYIIHEEVISALEKLLRKHPFQRIYAHEEIGIERTFARDRAVIKWCQQNNIEFKEFAQTGVFRRLKNRDSRHKLWKKFSNSPLLPIPKSLRKCSPPRKWLSVIEKMSDKFSLINLGFRLSTIQKSKVQSVSETAGKETLESFLFKRGLAYRGGISSPLTAMEAGSRLSVHLAWGTLTGRTVYQKTWNRITALKQLRLDGDPDAGKFSLSLRSFSSRLHWRDHFIQRLEHEPQMEFVALNPAYRELEYDDRPDFLEAWKSGTTGFPMVDACIRCLQATGFVNFRMRAMLTSFACHTLRINWKWIDHPMAHLYTDYEPGIHLSQLQMQAGVVGINTVRIYSPTKQIADQDPDVKFVHQWVPELREFSAETILEHSDKPLGDYPAQLVDWKTASSEMRRRIYAIRKVEGYKDIANSVYQKHGSRRMTPKKKSTKSAAKKSTKSAAKKSTKSAAKKSTKSAAKKSTKSAAKKSTK